MLSDLCKEWSKITYNITQTCVLHNSNARYQNILRWPLSIKAACGAVRLEWLKPATFRFAFLFVEVHEHLSYNYPKLVLVVPVLPRFFCVNSFSVTRERAQSFSAGSNYCMTVPLSLSFLFYPQLTLIVTHRVIGVWCKTKALATK